MRSLFVAFVLAIVASTGCGISSQNAEVNSNEDFEPNAPNTTEMTRLDLRSDSGELSSRTITIGDDLNDAVSKIIRHGGRHSPPTLTRIVDGKSVPYVAKHAYRLTDTVAIHINVGNDMDSVVKSIEILHCKSNPEYKGDGESVESVRSFNLPSLKRQL